MKRNAAVSGGSYNHKAPAGKDAGVPGHKGWYSRGYLPHLDQPGLYQAITFRLHDSVPAHVIYRWKDELGWQESIQCNASTLIALHERIVKYEDACHGACWLHRPDIARLIEDALLFFDDARYRQIAWCVMPNHVHTLIETFDGYPLDKVLHSWKSFTAHQANKRLNLSGEFWAREYYDRFMRNEQHMAQTIEYIEQNPVKAGWVDKPEAWPFSSASRKRVGVTE